jgi:hypothetical protein
MKKLNAFTAICIALIIIVLPGCQAIGEIFKAGMWSGIIIVVLIIALVLFLINRSSKK